MRCRNFCLTRSAQITACLMLVLLTGSPGFASVRVGARAGFSFARISGDSWDGLVDYSWSGDAGSQVTEGIGRQERFLRRAASFGLFCEWPVNSWLSLQPEVNIVPKGYSFKAEETEQETFYTSETPVFVRTKTSVVSGFACRTYLEVPLLLRANWRSSSRATPFILLGASLAVPFSSDVQSTGTAQVHDLDLITQEESDWQYTIDGSDFGLEEDSSTETNFILGGGVETNLNRFSIVAELRYSLSLSDTELGYGRAPESKGSFRCLQFYLGIVPELAWHQDDGASN